MLLSVTRRGAVSLVVMVKQPSTNWHLKALLKETTHCVALCMCWQYQVLSRERGERPESWSIREVLSSEGGGLGVAKDGRGTRTVQSPSEVLSPSWELQIGHSDTVAYSSYYLMVYCYGNGFKRVMGSGAEKWGGDPDYWEGSGDRRGSWVYMSSIGCKGVWGSIIRAVSHKA